jgi:UDP-3-O-[3-hydroxymyristoyl] glucosamine N-acyltransferase
MRQFTLAEIADRIGGVIESGDAALKIARVRPIEAACPGDITVVTRRGEVRAVQQTHASAAVVAARLPQVPLPTIRVLAPRLALAQMLELFYTQPRTVTGIDPRAFVAPEARMGPDANIGAGAYVARDVEVGARVDIYPGVYLGEGVQIGDDSIVFANVSIYPGTVIGRRARIHSGAVIGSDGFGFTAGSAGELYKIPQVGGVEIGDDVEIGANSTIDRATMTVTKVGRGTKIDNLVQIGHNVEIGEHVCIVAQSGVAGSARIGARAVLGAGAGVVDHISVGERARVAARSGAHRDVPAAVTVMGTPAILGNVFMRSFSLIPHLPDYRRRLKELEARCARLEAKLNDRPTDE